VYYLGIEGCAHRKYIGNNLVVVNSFASLLLEVGIVFVLVGYDFFYKLRR
jgi:hypothetical protein